MRTSYLLACMATLLFAGTYWYQTTQWMCPVPLSYRIGSIDESFEITETEAKDYVLKAESLWEEMANRNLFVYDETAAFTIDFVFDDRQAIANAEAAQREALNEKQLENEELTGQIKALQAEYDELAATYETRVANYQASLDEHNEAVQRYNDQGGAPPGVYEELERRRSELNAEAENLNRLSDELKDLAGSINQLGERGNRLVETYNEGVETYNAEFGYVREFTQGDYQGDSIHIYKFLGENELVRVLVHEFGHALGVDHVADKTALMYYLLEDTDRAPTLSESDRLAYQAVCGTQETFTQKVRRIIRQFIKAV